MVGGEVICGYYGAEADGVYPHGGDGTRLMSARHDTHHSSGPRDKVTLLLWGGENPSIYGSDGQMYTMTSAECSSKINSFLSHLNTKLRLLPVFRLKLHWLSGGTTNGPVADLVHRSGANGQTNN